MKKSAKAELRAKSAEDLATLAKTARDTLMKARFSKSVEGKTITIQQREQRRQVARLETMLGEKKIAEKKTVKAGVKS
jgi:ribosomal protein L29